ncbi:MAG: hypothetical protein V1663_04605 [archaeon]
MTYTESQLKSFVDGLSRADTEIKKQDPDFILAPIIGAIPFIDTLAIINPHFRLFSVEYPPSTSRFENLGEIIEDWFYNFLKENHIEDEALKLVFIDEVVSGTSAVRGHKYLNKSLEKIAKEDIKEIFQTDDIKRNGHLIGEYKKRIHDLKKQIKYHIIGIEDHSGRNQRSNNKAYNRLKREGLVTPIEVEKIITMDNPIYTPIQLKFSHKGGSGRPFYLPEVESFCTTPEYIEFLRSVARYIGKDPHEINPVNQSRIFNFTRYLSDQFKVPK